jgi:hypothetical protein
MKAIVAIAMAAAVLLAASGSLYAAESEVEALLNLLEKKGIVSREEVSELRADIAIKKQEAPAQAKPTAAPADWTQNVKWSGDVRFRSRGDWGKTAQNQPQTSAPTNASDIRKQRLLESVRSRFALEGKVNDFTYAGTRLVSGNTTSRSHDDILSGFFAKYPVMFEQYYIRFEASRSLTVRYGQYFSDLKLWAGKFVNPFETSEMTWDPDIAPGGVALQYASPTISPGFLPDLKVYSNLGMLWLDESANYNTDPILWGYQAGVKTEKFGELDTTANIAAAIYDFANLQGKSPSAISSGTNSRTWLGTYNYGIGATSLGTYMCEYNVFDLLWKIDNEKFLFWDMSHGFYGDLLYNASVHGSNDNKGAQVGAYIGKSKLKNTGDWKVKAEWRYIQRDAIPDFLPDSNFYGFGTYTNTATMPNVNGLPVSGGTNTRGTKLMLEYQLQKNSALNISYMWMEPIKSFDKRDPYNQFLMDIITKF